MKIETKNSSFQFFTVWISRAFKKKVKVDKVSGIFYECDDAENWMKNDDSFFEKKEEFIETIDLNLSVIRQSSFTDKRSQDDSGFETFSV
jgi:hypothetical protein